MDKKTVIFYVYGVYLLLAYLYKLVNPFRRKKASHSEWDALNKLKETSFPNDTAKIQINI